MHVITLLSDLGTTDTNVSAIKCILSGTSGSTNIVDISHDMRFRHLPRAAYVASSAYRHFPENSIHIIFFNSFSAPNLNLLLTKFYNQYILAPDNGIIPLITGNALSRCWLCKNFDTPPKSREWALAAKEITDQILNGSDPSAFLEEVLPQPPDAVPIPILFSNRLDCEILHTDRYSNIVLNITEDLFKTLVGDRKFSIKLIGARESIESISNHYTEVEEGRHLCRFNSNGYLEIAVNRSPAIPEEQARMPHGPIDYKRVSISILPA